MISFKNIKGDITMKRLSESTKSIMAILLAAAFFFGAAAAVHAENTTDSQKCCSQSSLPSDTLLADDWECIDFI